MHADGMLRYVVDYCGCTEFLQGEFYLDFGMHVDFVWLDGVYIVTFFMVFFVDQVNFDGAFMCYFYYRLPIDGIGPGVEIFYFCAVFFIGIRRYD